MRIGLQQAIWVLGCLLLTQCKELSENSHPPPSLFTRGMSARTLQDSFLNAKVDRPFNYQDPFFSGKVGPFTLTPAPAWSLFDSASGLVTGIPSAAGEVRNLVFSSGSGSTLITSTPLTFPVLGDPLKPPVGFEMGVREVLNRDITGDGVKIAISDTGLEIRHEDLIDNIIADASVNYLDGSSDPTLKNMGEGFCHGTAVAGVIAMTGWNSKGGRGIAPYAGIAGLNFIEGLNQKPSQGTRFLLDQARGDFDIFNQSWGTDLDTWNPIPPRSPIDFYVEQLRAGVNNLRGGKGALYVKAAGNRPDRNAALDVYQRSPYLMVVGALNSSNTRAFYSSRGSNLWLSAFGGEPVGSGAIPKLLTTDSSGCSQGLSRSGNCDYSSQYQGTSFAAPAVSGAVALILQQRPELNWREVKHILAATADRVDPNSNQWVTNNAGFHFHNSYGFGKVNANLAVAMAQALPVGSLGSFQSVEAVSGPASPIDFSNQQTLEFNVSSNLTLEAVALELDIEHAQPNALTIELLSPPRTKSTLLERNSSGANSQNIPGISFLSNAFYGENSVGTWTLSVTNQSAAPGKLKKFKLVLYGH